MRQPEAREDADAELPSEGEPRLVVPAGLVLDEVARHRLERQLERSAPHVAGVVAPISPLAAGASYRVCAEWRSLEPETLAVELPSRRPLVRCCCGQASSSRSGTGSSTSAAEPSCSIPARTCTTPGNRSKSFGSPPSSGARRFRAARSWCSSEDRATQSSRTGRRRLVNRLIRRDVEARLALPIIADGLQLTCPLLLCEASMRALVPDAVVALDPEASAQAQHWCRDERSTVFIELDRELSTGAELVSWQIGRSSGRVRARIGRRIDAPAFSALVRRLCAGPQPAPPVDGAVPEKRTIPHGRRARELSRARSSCAVVTGPWILRARRGSTVSSTTCPPSVSPSACSRSNVAFLRARRPLRSRCSRASTMSKRSVSSSRSGRGAKADGVRCRAARSPFLRFRGISTVVDALRRLVSPPRAGSRRRPAARCTTPFAVSGCARSSCPRC